MDSPASSRALPGAWASTWTLFREPCDAEKAPGASEPPSPIEDFQICQTQIIYPAESKQPSFSLVYASLDDFGTSQGEESLPSDDFYSFNELSESEGSIPNATTSIADVPKPNSSSRELSSVNVMSTTADNDSSEDFHVRRAVETPHVVFDNGSPSTFRSSADVSARFQNRSGLDVDSISLEVKNPEEPQALRQSVYSNYSTLNYQGVCGLIEQLDRDRSEESIALRENLRGRDHFVLPEMKQETNEFQGSGALEFSQPNGENSWTLSLDPSVFSSECIVQSLGTSSVESSNTSVTSKRNSPTPPHLRSTPQSPSFLSSEALNDEICTARAGSNSFAFVPAEAQGRVALIFPPFTSESSRSRKVVQMTKDFYGKFKKLVNLKTFKAKKEESNASNRRFSIAGVTTAPSKVQKSPTSWSFIRRRRFRSLEKGYTSSITPIPEEPTADNKSANDRYSYEHHARPKTLDEIKTISAKRRFSLPVFGGQTAQYSGT